MAQSEGIKTGIEQAQVTLAEAEAKLRAATTAAERVEAQKLVRAAQEQMEQAQVAAAAESISAPATPAPEVKKHVVQKGESLSLIAKQYYGDIHKWKQIYEANKDLIGNNPDVIQPGQELVIPD